MRKSAVGDSSFGLPRMCAWQSTRPGRTVKLDKSMTRNPEGAVAPIVTMRSPSTTSMTFVLTSPVLTSSNLPALRTTRCGAMAEEGAVSGSAQSASSAIQMASAETREQLCLRDVFIVFQALAVQGTRENRWTGFTIAILIARAATSSAESLRDFERKRRLQVLRGCCRRGTPGEACQHNL